MGPSLPNIIIILVIVLIFFGAGKLPKVMGDLGKGIRNFKYGLKNDETDEPNETDEKKKSPKEKE